MTHTSPNAQPGPAGPGADLPFVLACVRDDAAAGRLGHWGASTVIDELTGVASFDEELFDALHAAAGLSARFPVGNAGLIHVYGYWFSEVPTPFGWKRDRWQQGDLARVFGLAPDAFLLRRGDEAAAAARHVTAGAPVASTPLQRVTDAALPVLERPPSGARVAEAPIGRASSRVVLLDAAARSGSPAGAGSPALVYGIAETASAPLRLITTFPFGGDAAELVAEFAQRPAARWNAVVDS